ncbi:hypothetical protein V2J09_018188 [Rumex salicifolius]
MMSQSNAPLFNEFKKQASFYIKEKIKTARLALTDVTPAQLMTEEATSGIPRSPDTRTMAFISRAAFEVDDYWRVVDILHARLENFDRRNWRPSYNALIVLEHLLTHGPVSVAEEFQDEKCSIKEMQFFQHIDEKGFNWGVAVRKKAERLLELLEKGPLLKEERNRARQVTRGIQGFGSFSERMVSSASGHQGAFGRSHSQFNENGNQDDYGDENYSKIISQSGEDRYIEDNSTRKITSPNSEENMGEKNPLLGCESIDTESLLLDLEDHPFSPIEKQSRTSLLGCNREDFFFSEVQVHSKGSLTMVGVRDGLSWLFDLQKSNPRFANLSATELGQSPALGSNIEVSGHHEPSFQGRMSEGISVHKRSHRPFLFCPSTKETHYFC